MATIVIPPRQPVFVLRKERTYFGVHPMSPILHTPQTFVAVFMEESNARAWADGLNASEVPPVRDYVERPDRFAWMDRRVGGREGGPLGSKATFVERIVFRELLACLAGRNIKCRVYLDASDISKVLDVRPVFDDAAVRALMEADFGLRTCEDA